MSVPPLIQWRLHRSQREPVRSSVTARKKAARPIAASTMGKDRSERAARVKTDTATGSSPPGISTTAASLRTGPMVPVLPATTMSAKGNPERMRCGQICCLRNVLIISQLCAEAALSVHIARSTALMSAALVAMV